MLKTISFFLLGCVFGANAVLELPSYIPKCNFIEKEEDIPQLEQCFMEKANETRPFMKKGIPELGIPSISFVTIPRIEIEQKARAFQYKCIFTEVGVQGLDEYVVEGFRYFPKNNTYFGKVILGKLVLNGTYHLEGKVFGQDLQQDGPMSANLNNTVSYVTMIFEMYTKKGVKYGKIVDFLVSIDIGGAEGQFYNLFGDNQVLNKATNEFLSESSKSIIEAAKPEVVNLIKHLMRTLANRIIGLLPFDSYFPPPVNK